MKRNLLIFVSAIFLAGCSKNEKTEDVSSQASSLRVESVVSSNDFQSRIQLFGLLTGQEKFTMWQKHLVKARAQFAASGERRKIASIDQLLNNISVSMFDSQSSGQKDVFLNYFIPVWSGSAKNIFTDEELYDLTFNPGAQIIGRFADDEIGGGLEGGPANCFCHVGTSGFSCRRMTIGIPPTITNGICERTAAECDASSNGCGWLWLQSCSGNHCQF